MTADKAVKIFRHNADEAAILATLAKLKLGNIERLDESDEMVLAALRRSSDHFSNASADDISIRLAEYSESQIMGLSSNVKGILHELEFAKLENEDGDQILASLYPETTHPGFDIQFQDLDSGDSWAVQLKATEDTSYVGDWMDAHPDGEIMVTDEIATRMGLESTGFSNEELTVRVEDFLDKAVDLAEEDTIWTYFPALSAFSIAVALVFLWRRYASGEISLDRFKMLAVRMTGLKLAKIGSIVILLSIPVVGFITSIGLITKILISLRSM